MKFELKRVPRGQNSGKGFFVSTFRFDLPLAQALEKLSLANGLSMSMVINQILQQFVDQVEVPDNVIPVKTAHATAWGKDKPTEVVPEVIKLKVKPKAAKDAEEAPEPAAKKPRAKKSVKSEEPQDEPKKAAASVIGKLKKKSVDEALPTDD